jgi:4-hydroxy-4-methyl-2-oxoglutarate aldolase
MITIKPRVQKTNQKLIEVYSQVCTSTIGHMTDFGFIKDLSPISRPIRFLGNAVTVKLPYMDSTALHLALSIVEQGDVIVVDMSGDIHRACWGGGVSYAAKVKKVAGAVIGGAICDVQEIIQYKMPVFSAGVSPLTTRILGNEGEINTPISISGVTVNPGDMIVADDDGIFVIDPENPRALEMGERAIFSQNSEVKMRENMDNGVDLAELSGANKYLPN